MNCRHCGAEIADHEKFCRYCGKAQQKICPKCGTKLADTAKFCNACGAALEAPQQKPVKAPKAKKKQPWGLIAIIAVLCIALLAGGFFGYKALTEFRDRQQELENQLADRDREDKKDKEDKEDNDRTETDPEPDKPAPDIPVPDAPAVEEPPMVVPEEPAYWEEPALPYRPVVERPAVDFEEFYIGLVLPGSKSSGQNYDIYEGLCEMTAELGLEDRRIWVVEEFRDADSAYPACRELAAAGCNLVFIASPLTGEYELALAEEYPDTVFVVLGGTAAAISGLPNLVNAWPKTHEMWFTAGAAAGLQLAMDLETGLIDAPFAAFLVEEHTTEAISDYSAFYLGMKSIVPDAVLFTAQHQGDPNEARGLAEEMVHGICCSILVEHRPGSSSIAAEVAAEAREYGIVCHDFSGNMEPLLQGYEIDGLAMDISWSLLLGQIIWDYVDGAPMKADYTIGVADGLFGWYCDGTFSESAAAIMEEMTAKLCAGEAIFYTDNFICYPDGTAGLKDGHVTVLPIWDMDFDGVADCGNAVKGSMVWESEYRSAPVFNLQIEGIEVMN